MVCFLGSFRYSRTEFSSLLKYVRYKTARSYSDYTTVTFLKPEKRQNNSPCDAEPLTEPSSKVRCGSSSSANSPKLAVFCCFLLLCLLSSSPRLQCFSLSWLSMLKVWRTPISFPGIRYRLFQKVFENWDGMGWDRMSTARTGWNMFSYFPSHYNCPVISPLSGSPAVAWKGTVFIYTSLVQAVQCRGRGQGATVIYTP